MIDSHYDKVKMLLPMSGENNGTIFPDYSPAPGMVNVIGDPRTVTLQYTTI